MDLVGFAAQLLQRLAVAAVGVEVIGDSGELAELAAHPLEIVLEQPGRELGRGGVAGHGIPKWEIPQGTP